MLPVGVVLDPSVCVVMGELRGRSGPAKEKQTGRGGGLERERFVNPTSRRLINLNTHMHTCTSPADPQKSRGSVGVGWDSTRRRCAAV